MPNIFTAGWWVIIGKQNTDVLSTTAVNNLVIIVYYDVCYTYRSSRSKEGFRQKCLYRSGGTFCSHSEWTSANVPIPAHFIVSYLGPEQSRALPMMHALNWCKVKKSTCEYWKVVPHVTSAFVALTVYIYTDVPAAIWRFIWHNWTCSQTTVISGYVLRQCLHKGPLICTSHLRCTTITCYPPPKKNQSMSVIYGDNFLHHSQSFRIMVKGWKWDPRIWYDLLYNWPSTHKMACKYLHADQSYDGMHLLLHWTTLYVMHDRYARILSVQWRPFWTFLMATITRTTWCILTFVMICYTPGHQYTHFHANIHM